MAVVTVEYDCGMKVDQFASLKDDQTLLANAPLADTLVVQADYFHDQTCKVC